jgi:hypothetical protein
MSVIPATREVGGSWSEASLVKSMKLYLKKQTKPKSAVGVGQVVEHLPFVSKVLSSNSSTAKK